MPKDLRTFIDQVARAMPQEIQTVSREVDPCWGATAVAARLEQQQRSPTLSSAACAARACPSS